VPPWIQSCRPWADLPRWPVRASACAGLLWAAVLLPGFAAIVDSPDTPGALSADAMVQRGAAPLAGNALDKALTGHGAPGQVNLDLLLDMTRHDAAALASTASVRPALAGRPNPTPSMPLAGALLGTEAGLPLTQAPRAQSPRDWALPPAHSRNGGADVGMATVDAGPGDWAGSGVDPDAVRAPVRRVVQLLRDNQGWILGGVLVLVLLGIVVKVFGRRI